MLTPRELRVLRAIDACAGDVACAAKRTHLRPNTVRSYLESARDKLGVDSTWKAVAEARRRKLFRPPAPAGPSIWDEVA